MIDRRTLLRGSGAALLPAAGLPRAQPQSRPMHIEYLSARFGPNEFEQAFERGLRERGLVAGTQVVIDYRFAGGDAERENANIAALVASKPDVVVLADGLITRPARSLNLAAPIVVAAFGDPAPAQQAARRGRYPASGRGAWRQGDGAGPGVARRHRRPHRAGFARACKAWRSCRTRAPSATARRSAIFQLVLKQRTARALGIRFSHVADPGHRGDRMSRERRAPRSGDRSANSIGSPTIQGYARKGLTEAIE